MSARRFYAVVSVGANRAASEQPLRFAHSDAMRFAAVMASDQGAIDPKDVFLLVGANATYANLDRVLAQLAAAPPLFLAFFFSGHGNRDGILLEDLGYSYDRLHTRLERIATRASVVVLDACESGGFAKSATVGGLGDLEAAFARQLLLAEPGQRSLMASRADRNTKESAHLRSGVFTHALIRGLVANFPGDLIDDEGTTYVSDRAAHTRAKTIMAHYNLRPTARDLTGDFPMIRAQDEIIGGVDIRELRPTDGMGVEIDLLVADRRYLPTEIVCTPVGPFLQIGPRMRHVFVPTSSHSTISVPFESDVGSIPGAANQWLTRGACRVRWEVVVRDQHQRVLAGQRLTSDYHTMIYR